MPVGCSSGSKSLYYGSFNVDASANIGVDNDNDISFEHDVDIMSVFMLMSRVAATNSYGESRPGEGFQVKWIFQFQFSKFLFFSSQP